MSVLIECPKCQKKLKIDDSVLGKNIKCPGCAAVFASKAPADGAAPAPSRKAAPPPDEDEDEAPRRPAKAAAKADEDEDDRPKKPAAKKSRDDDEDEDDRPRKSAAKKGRASDDDDDDRPARKAQKKGGAGKVLLIVGTLVLLLCGGCGTGIWYVYYKGKEFVNAVSSEFGRISSEMQAQESKEPLAKAKPATFPAGWKEFRQDKYGFSVWLPGTPKAAQFNTDERTEFELPWPQQPAGAPKSGYWIKVSERPTADGGPLSTRLILEQLVGEGGLHVVGLGLATNTKYGLFAGKPGRAWDVQDDKGGVWHFRACLSGTKGYILGVGPEAKVPVADADTFFSSFELVGPGGKAEGPKPATQKAEGPKPDEQPTVVSAQALARELMTDDRIAFPKYAGGKLLQVEGTVAEQSVGPDRSVTEAIFKVDVMEGGGRGGKRAVPVYCRFTTPVPANKAGDVAVGKKITVRGKLTGWDLNGKQATLNECVLVGSEPSKPGAGVDPAKPGDQTAVVKAEDLAKDLNDNQQAAFKRYFGKPLKIDAGVVSKRETNADGTISGVVFQVDVLDKKTSTMKPFLITCRFANPVPAGGPEAETIAVGKTVSVRGKLGGVSYIDRKATINECVLARPGTDP